MRRDTFYSVHPAVAFAFFTAVMLITAFVLHPVITGISLVCALAYAVVITGGRAVKFALFAALPLIILVSLLNPLFNHEGVTPLFCLWNGNAVTLEAIVYGLVSACMFAALIIWFYCMHAVMTSDKLIYLFGRVLPALSLIFSMVLRFVPRLVGRIREVSAAQRSVAPPMGKSVVKGVRHGISVLSVTVTWALESAVIMSDSMRSRGFGGRGRTSYALFRFTVRDAVTLAAVGALTAVSAALIAAKKIDFRFYPSIKCAPAGPLTALGFAAFAALCLLPVFLNIKESISWRIISSRL